MRSFLSGILPKFEQSFNSFATTSYDEVDNTETERIWKLRLLKMLQKVKNADFFWHSYDEFLLPYRNCVASSAKNKVFYFFFSNPDHRMSLSPLVFASLADRLILRVAEKIEVFFLLRN